MPFYEPTTDDVTKLLDAWDDYYLKKGGSGTGKRADFYKTDILPLCKKLRLYVEIYKQYDGAYYSNPALDLALSLVTEINKNNFRWTREYIGKKSNDFSVILQKTMEIMPYLLFDLCGNLYGNSTNNDGESNKDDYITFDHILVAINSNKIVHKLVLDTFTEMETKKHPRYQDAMIGNLRISSSLSSSHSDTKSDVPESKPAIKLLRNDSNDGAINAFNGFLQKIHNIHKAHERHSFQIENYNPGRTHLLNRAFQRIFAQLDLVYHDKTTLEQATQRIKDILITVLVWNAINMTCFKPKETLAVNAYSLHTLIILEFPELGLALFQRYNALTPKDTLTLREITIDLDEIYKKSGKEAIATIEDLYKRSDNTLWDFASQEITLALIKKLLADLKQISANASFFNRPTGKGFYDDKKYIFLQISTRVAMHEQNNGAHYGDFEPIEDWLIYFLQQNMIHVRKNNQRENNFGIFQQTILATIPRLARTVSADLYDYFFPTSVSLDQVIAPLDEKTQQAIRKLEAVRPRLRYDRTEKKSYSTPKLNTPIEESLKLKLEAIIKNLAPYGATNSRFLVLLILKINSICQTSKNQTADVEEEIVTALMWNIFNEKNSMQPNHDAEYFGDFHQVILSHLPHLALKLVRRYNQLPIGGAKEEHVDRLHLTHRQATNHLRDSIKETIDKLDLETEFVGEEKHTTDAKEEKHVAQNSQPKSTAIFNLKNTLADLARIYGKKKETKTSDPSPLSNPEHARAANRHTLINIAQDAMDALSTSEDEAKADEAVINLIVANYDLTVRHNYGKPGKLHDTLLLLCPHLLDPIIAKINKALANSSSTSSARTLTVEVFINDNVAFLWRAKLLESYKKFKASEHILEFSQQETPAISRLNLN